MKHIQVDKLTRECAFCGMVHCFVLGQSSLTFHGVGLGGLDPLAAHFRLGQALVVRCPVRVVVVRCTVFFRAIAIARGIPGATLHLRRGGRVPLRVIRRRPAWRRGLVFSAEEVQEAAEGGRKW